MVERRHALVTLEPQGGARVGKTSTAFLAFVLDGELYAVELAGIQSIIAVAELTEVPRAHRCILGICSVRGVLVTVVDLRRRMQLTERPLTRQARILITTLGDETLGLLVDAVHRVARVPAEQFEPTAALIGEDTTEHVVGIARVRKRDDWSASGALLTPRIATGADAVTPRPAGERHGEEDETEMIVVLNLDTLCRVVTPGARKT